MAEGTKVSPDLIEKLKGVRERIETRTGGSGDITWYKPKDGVHNIRILPGKDGGLFYKERGTHWGIGDDNQQIRCPNITDDSGKPCFICETRELFKQAGTKEDLAMADALEPKIDYMINVIDREDEAAGVKIWCAPPTAFDVIAGFVQDPQYGAIWDAEEGVDFMVDRKKSGSAYDYKASRFERLATPLSDDAEQMKTWLDTAHDLDEAAGVATYAKTFEALTGEEYEGEEPEAEEKVVEETTEEAASEGEGGGAKEETEKTPEPVEEKPAEEKDDAEDLRSKIKEKLAKFKKG